jgi:uncharacterized protein (UPF0335 family)
VLSLFNIKLAAIALAVVLALGYGMYQYSVAYVANAKLERLEKEKKNAEDNVLKLQGQVESKNLDIARLSQAVVLATQTAVEASKSTQSASSSYTRVRTNAPVFVSTDDAGKIKELVDKLNLIYPDR